jgi:hypothetical protein
MRPGSTSVRAFWFQPTSEFSDAGKSFKPENSSKDPWDHEKFFAIDVW